MSCVKTEVSERSDIAGEARNVPGVGRPGVQLSPGKDNELSLAIISSSSAVDEEETSSDGEKLGDPFGVDSADAN